METKNFSDSTQAFSQSYDDKEKEFNSLKANGQPNDPWGFEQIYSDVNILLDEIITSLVLEKSEPDKTELSKLKKSCQFLIETIEKEIEIIKDLFPVGSDTMDYCDVEDDDKF